MLTVTYYRCEVCGNEYPSKDVAEACEASKPPTTFQVGQQVHYEGDPGGGFTRASGRSVDIREMVLTSYLREDTARQCKPKRNQRRSLLEHPSRTRKRVRSISLGN